MLMNQFSLSSFGVAMCNLFILEVCNLYFQLLVVEMVTTRQYNRLKIPFVCFSQTVGTRLYLYWCRGAEEDSAGSS